MNNNYNSIAKRAQKAQRALSVEARFYRENRAGHNGRKLELVRKNNV